MNTYLIQFQGPVEVNEVNWTGPHQMVVNREDPAGTQVSICTDQSGLIGLIRHLHGLGYAFLWIKRETA